MDPVATHSRHLLQQLQEQRIQGLLCDCMLVVRGVCFKAHKNVLAAFSQYFSLLSLLRGLFQNSSGQKNDVFHLDIKNVSGIGHILDFMYTSRLDLNQDNVQVMLDIAQCLQVQNALTLCHRFLRATPAERLRRRLTPEASCAGCPQHVLPGQALEDPPPHAPLAPGETPKQTPEPGTGSCPDLPLRQPHYYYKLRSLYSKQYYRQASGSAPQPTPEPPQEPSTPENPPSTASHPDCSLPIQGQPGHGPTPCPEPETTSPQPPKPMRLKKAVHLRTLHLLKLQTSAEPPSEPSTGDSSAERPGAARDDPAQQASDHGAMGRDSQGPNSSENFRCEREAERPQEPATLEDPSQALQPQRQYACELCGKPFKHPSNLELHKRSHTGEKPFECNICGKHFSQAGNLQTHLRRHSGEKPYICEICGKRSVLGPRPQWPWARKASDGVFYHCRFAASGDVQRHIIIHSGEKPHLCDICGRGFSNFSNLKEHKKTHTADKVFTCDECGKSFNMQRKLVKHRVRHTGERPYSCSACGKSFGGSGDLRRHVRTHTGEKPYTCDVCDKGFTRAAVLRRHRKMHGRADAGGRDEAALDRAPGPTEPAPPGPARFSRDGPAAGHPATALPAACEPRAPKLPGKLPRAPPQPVAPAFPDADSEASADDSMAIIRSSLAALDHHCGDAPGGRAPTAYRNPEGHFSSSMTLWGLAMKTLQSEGELDQ
ncbi:LOW QUALITY PROTEIN: zinc finger and BTB domain-containing protein 49 [Rhynchocyon petersi]